MRSPLKAAVPALALLTAMTAMTACSAATPAAAPTATGSAPAGATSAAAPGSTTPAAGATSTKAAATATTTKAAATGGGGQCKADDLDVNITAQQNGNPKGELGLMTITNSGKQPCSVNGWLTVTLVNAANEAVSLPTKKVNEPGGPENFKIIAGGSAYAGIKWVTCDKSDTTCGVGNTLRYALGDSTEGPAATLDGFPAAEASGITMKSLQIGTIQPSRQGVVAW